MKWRGMVEAVEGDAMVDAEEVGVAVVAATPTRTLPRWAEIVVGES